MVYLERTPSQALADCIRVLWYCSAPDALHQRERVLPDGCVQLIVSTGTEALTDCGADSGEERLNCTKPIAPAILVGARARYDVIHMRDMVELIGVVFRPGGLGPWLRERADLFFETSTPLNEVCNPRALRTQLRESSTPEEKLALVDGFLSERLGGRDVKRRPLVKAALAHLRDGNVQQTAQSLGISERRLHQIFCHDVGLPPKLWARVRRFQTAVRVLHSGTEMRWDQLSLACGYYDQSHFSNDFRAFSGVDPTTYSARRGPWRNHMIFE